jgi:hypothetical protein
MAVEIDADVTFLAGTPRQLFSIPGLLSAPDAAPDLTSDGTRFLFALSEGANSQTPFMVVLNWQAALKKRTAN